MKKELKLIFISLFLVSSLIFSLSFISSLTNGECEVMLRGSCTDKVGYIVMGLTSYTNAHAENSTSGSYPYVLCCARGGGKVKCESDGSTITNKLIGLSSTTNAHGEIPSNTNYIVPVCYEDFKCYNYSDSCTNPDYNLGILSLSSTTNAHLGNFSEYSTKICCHSNAPKMCYLNSANWSVIKTQEGNRVRLQVYGDDPYGCKGLEVNFSVYEKDGATKQLAGILQPLSVTFGSDAVAYGEWKTQYIYDGLLEGNPEFGFDASIKVKPTIMVSSNNELEITKGTVCESPGVQICNEYPDQTSCDGDTCGVADYTLGTMGITCGGTTSCYCYWDSTSNSCSGTYTTLDTPGPTTGCNKGYTLCNKSDNSGQECVLKDTCGYPPLSDGDGICEFGEGCTSSDCALGGKDTCGIDLSCINGRCWNNNPIETGCVVASTIIKNCDTEPVGWMTINVTDSCTNPSGTLKNVLCPTESALPFYGPLAAILTLATLVIIYYFYKKKNKSVKHNKAKVKKNSKKLRTKKRK